MSPAHVGLPCAAAGLPRVAAGGTRAAPAFGAGVGLARQEATLWSCRNAPSSVRRKGGSLKQLIYLAACQLCRACRGKQSLCSGACSGIVGVCGKLTRLLQLTDKAAVVLDNKFHSEALRGPDLWA